VESDKLKNIWPQWRLVEELGRGAYGVVYKAVRDEHGVIAYSAIKVISIPQQESEELSIRADGLDDNAARKYFEDVVAHTVDEIKVLESMKGNSNIVSIEDYTVLSEPDRIAWDIFIRMEYLTSFLDFIADKKADEATVIKLGMDMCNALELCAKRGIVHRDVKPENIFVSPFGDFKLGDFGIARELDRLNHSLTISGTQNYIAPEVRSMHYDATVDIYSLGLVLYKLLNKNRLPFLDPDAQLVNPQDYHAALGRRFSGEEFPDPVDASPALVKVIKRACEFDPLKRYQTASDFKNALGAVSNIKPVLKIVSYLSTEAEAAQMGLPTKVAMPEHLREYESSRLPEDVASYAEPIVEPIQTAPLAPPIQSASNEHRVKSVEAVPSAQPTKPTPIPQPKIGPGYIKKASPSYIHGRPNAQPQNAHINNKKGIIAIIVLIAAVVIIGVIAVFLT